MLNSAIFCFKLMKKCTLTYINAKSRSQPFETTYESLHYANNMLIGIEYLLDGFYEKNMPNFQFHVIYKKKPTQR